VKILGIESSCDEMAMAVVDSSKQILSHVVVSQIDIHKEFGGVVPEIASRNHLDIIDEVVKKTIRDSGITFNDLDAISATTGPGLMGGLIVGAISGKTLSSIFHKPFIPINHLEGHILIPRIIYDDIQFPFLTLLISGGHSQILLTKGIGNYVKIGDTIDDSLGECFDKVAQMLGLEYPGGPKIERLARYGNQNRFKFVKPLIDAGGKGRDTTNTFNFSFSGLKTAVRREIEQIKNITEQDTCDICASFQKTITSILKDRLENVIKYLNDSGVILNKLIIAGGVSANQYIKTALESHCAHFGYTVVTPPLKLCTDNGVMTAWAGIERYRLGQWENSDVLSIKSRWEL